MRRRWGGRPRVQDRRDDALANLDPHDFERIVADYYREQGYRVEHCGRPDLFDGGIDLKLFRGGEYTIVQCKRENALQVTHNVVHELLGVMVTERADRAIVVNAGEFTRYARESAAKEPRIELVDGSTLRAMLGACVIPLGDLVSHRADSLTEGADDRRYYRRRRWQRDADSSAGVFKVFGAIVAVLLMLAWMNSGVEKASIAQRQQAAAPAVAAPSLPVPPDRDTSAAVMSWSNPCHEVIDALSGTYIDHCAKVAPRRPAAAAEIRESQRRADEAMRVLASHTPEVQLTLPRAQPESTWPNTPSKVTREP